ncbi:MAG: radical SAM protein [Lachnospiraceae bacterium]|nr:radical SAM protein [Lachnospiraceae bacterium]
MKKSKYLYPYEKNGFYILSGSQWNVYKVEEEVFEKIKNNNINDMEEEVVQRLKKELLLFEDWENEDDIILDKFNEAIYGNKLKLTIIPTELCNFRCVYCYETHNKGKMTDDVEQAIVKFAKRNAKDYSSVDIEWFGGEPLLESSRVITLSKQIKEVCKNNKIPMVSSMTTNGYLLTQDILSQLIDANVLYYQITLDGPESIHNKMRPLVSGEGSFNKIYNNLLDAKKVDKYFKIAIRINVSKDNKDSINELLKKLDRDFGDDTRFTVIMETVKDWGGDNECVSNDTLLEDRGDLEEEMAILGDNLKTHSNFSESAVGRMCYSGRKNGYVINFNGEILKCARAQYESDEIQKKNLIGQLMPNGKIEYKSSDAQWLKIYWNIKYDGKDCDNCWAKPNCVLSICPLAKVANIQPKCLLKEMGKSIDVYINTTITQGKYKIV